MTSTKEEGQAVKIPIRHLAVITVSLPFGALLLCIYLSIRFNFEKATATHCGVYNFLPSISSAIGEFVPQCYIWRLAIAIHSAPRFLFSAMYLSFLRKSLPKDNIFKHLRRLATFLNVLENFALIGLSFVSSKENYNVHKVFFITFMVCSELYMTLMCLLLKDKTTRIISPYQRLSFKRKKVLTIMNICCFFVALYFFYRHNHFCEPGMYTIFALLEYIVVLTNMAFHMTAYYDFYHQELSVEEKSASTIS